MGNHSQYMQAIDKYNMDELRSKYISFAEYAETAPVSVGLFGEGPTIMKVLANILQFPELNSILLTREFCLHISCANERAFYQKNAQGEVPLSFPEFVEMLQGNMGLDDWDEVFEGGITVCSSLLNGLTLTAATLEKGADPEVLLYTDISVICLSATRLLSMQERAFAKNPLISNPYFFLCDFEKIREDERDNVQSVFSSFTFGPAYLVPSDDYNFSELYDKWKYVDGLAQLRQSKIDAYISPMVSAEVQRILESVIGERDLMTRTIRHLHDAAEELSKYGDKTTRYISVNYIDAIITNTTSALLNFYEKMNREIMEGVKEEQDVQALQDALPHFIAGAWSEFVDNSLNPQVQENIHSLETAIETYIDEKAELFLKELLAPEEYGLIETVISDAMNLEYISGRTADNISGSASMDRNGNAALRKVLPKCLIALGGIAVLSSGFLPGALLIVAGWKGNREVNVEIQEELIAAGKKLNYQYLKEVQGNLEHLTERIRAETSAAVERCYAGMLDSLIQLTQSYQEKTEAVHDKIASIRADLEVL